MRVAEFTRLLRERGINVNDRALLRCVKQLLGCLDVCDLMHIYLTTPSLRRLIVMELKRRNLDYRLIPLNGGSRGEKQVY